MKMMTVATPDQWNGCMNLMKLNMVWYPARVQKGSVCRLSWWTVQSTCANEENRPYYFKRDTTKNIRLCLFSGWKRFKATLLTALCITLMWTQKGSWSGEVIPTEKVNFHRILKMTTNKQTKTTVVHQFLHQSTNSPYTDMKQTYSLQFFFRSSYLVNIANNRKFNDNHLLSPPVERVKINLENVLLLRCKYSHLYPFR